MGWIRLDRKIQNHWLWDDGETFDRRSAWIDLLMLANYEDKKVLYKGKIITCKRGDVNLSITQLSERWKWSRAKVMRFLRTLERDGMVTTNVTRFRTVITVENYAFYQDVNNAPITTDVTTDVTTDEHQTDITNKINNITNKQCNNIDDQSKEIYMIRAREKLEEEYEDVDRLMRVISERIARRKHQDPIRDIYAYCLKVAETEGVKKNG